MQGKSGFYFLFGHYDLFWLINLFEGRKGSVIGFLQMSHIINTNICDPHMGRGKILHSGHGLLQGNFNYRKEAAAQGNGVAGRSGKQEYDFFLALVMT